MMVTLQAPISTQRHMSQQMICIDVGSSARSAWHAWHTRMLDTEQRSRVVSTSKKAPIALVPRGRWQESAAATAHERQLARQQSAEVLGPDAKAEGEALARSHAVGRPGHPKPPRYPHGGAVRNFR